MNERQKVALTHPCYRAVDTVDRRFHRTEPPWSSILSLNK